MVYGARRFGLSFTRLATVVCLTLGVLGLGAVGEPRAATPPSLVGETFTGTELTGHLAGMCFMPNEAFGLTFSTTGRATGPYPGTFTESGSFDMNAGRLTAFSATFSIASTAGSVTGTKTLAGSSGSASCTEPNPSTIRVDATTVSYTATINGAYRDTGKGSVSMGGVAQEPLGNFHESFTTSNGVVPLQNVGGQQGSGQGRKGNGQGGNGQGGNGQGQGQGNGPGQNRP